MLDKKIWIILVAVLGPLVLLLVLTVILFSWKRSKRRIRSFSLRAVTPLDDAEFESWRRPSEHIKRHEKVNITAPVPAHIDLTSAMLEKEVILYEQSRTPSPPSPPISPLPARLTKSPPSIAIQKPDRVRRKVSVSSSIADRPPTPYSPTESPDDFPHWGSHVSRKSGSAPYPHYPSMSEASAFDFELANSYGISPPNDRRPLHHSYARYGDSV
ncbi:hypothetical protein M011DRAFT_404527 [Sporormia fimetaria CBS 119925]|uniref:Uncharacterized protein n=1 Tax=Sporormia fimetaria CBS 119925 TaxID=1340428 RepID=A0A6A6V8V2_9PLEO|nr:hypothetical protein M011DRAFT_404527 [Sporormia fimetaria CBS 119925]